MDCDQLWDENLKQSKHVESVTGPMFGRGFDSLQLHNSVNAVQFYWTAFLILGRKTFMFLSFKIKNDASEAAAFMELSTRKSTMGAAERSEANPA